MLQIVTQAVCFICISLLGYQGDSEKLKINYETWLCEENKQTNKQKCEQNISACSFIVQKCKHTNYIFNFTYHDKINQAGMFDIVNL